MRVSKERKTISIQMDDKAPLVGMIARKLDVIAPMYVGGLPNVYKIRAGLVRQVLFLSSANEVWVMSSANGSLSFVLRKRSLSIVLGKWSLGIVLGKRSLGIVLCKESLSIILHKQSLGIVLCKQNFWIPRGGHCSYSACHLLVLCKLILFYSILYLFQAVLCNSISIILILKFIDLNRITFICRK